MTCEKCKGITKEQVMIGYYLCRFNTDENIQYTVKPAAKCCSNFKQKDKNAKQTTNLDSSSQTKQV